MSVSKKELVDRISSKTSVSKKDIDKVINAFTAELIKSLAEGEQVAIAGLGSFVITEHAARTGINPSTKEKIEIAAYKSAKWKPAKAVKTAINDK
jgi:Bacterial nucleoid DNA-binding protein